MPEAEYILQGLFQTANQFRVVGFAWHLVLAAILIALLAGLRPGRWVVLVIPVLIASVSTVAWFANNPFNGAVSAVCAIMLGIFGVRLDTPIRLANPFNVVIGAILVGFGWVYPHFVDVNTAAAYLILAPTGVIPCPSFSVAIGLTLVYRGFRSRAWSLTLVGFGLFYGVFGVFVLNVYIDVFLIIGALWLAVSSFVSEKFKVSDALF